VFELQDERGIRQIGESLVVPIEFLLRVGINEPGWVAANEELLFGGHRWLFSSKREVFC
jgi:hypothetical protein